MHRQANDNELLPSQGEAINDLFTQHYRASLRIASGILRSKMDAEDAVQTAYCAAFRHLNAFRGESSFKTWITRIVVNCCLMQLRERHAKPQLDLNDFLPMLRSHDATPEALCYLAELRAAHTGAVSGLPGLLQDVYSNCVISDVAFSEVATQLGLTAPAAKSRLLRARRRIEHALRPLVQRRAA